MTKNAIEQANEIVERALPCKCPVLANYHSHRCPAVHRRAVAAEIAKLIEQRDGLLEALQGIIESARGIAS